MINVEDVLESYRRLRVSVDRFYEGLNEIKIYECPDTGYRFYYPKELVGDQSFYESLIHEKNRYYPDWRWEYTEAFKSLTGSHRVLEIGCGSGNFLNHLSKQGLQAVGLDFNEVQVKAARTRGLDVYNESIEIYAEANSDKYDAVCFFQVLEHIPDVRLFIEASLKTVRRGGKLILGVPNSNPYLFKYDRLHALNLPPHHTGLWNQQSLSNLKNEFPMKLIRLAIEPLFEADYYWRLKKQNWQTNNKFLYYTLGQLPKRAESYVVRGYGKLGVGRNIIAIFEKL